MALQEQDLWLKDASAFASANIQQRQTNDPDEVAGFSSGWFQGFFFVRSRNDDKCDIGKRREISYKFEQRDSHGSLRYQF